MLSPDAAERLLSWYEDNRRNLPWRRSKDPYRIWISEIMLQQTRVEAVIPYYERFLEALPDVRSLSECPDDRLNKLWQGLGYYRRAAHLKEAAVKIVKEFEGRFPGKEADLLTLPGIGSYTACAIASIAFGEPVPAVDGNIARIMSRITAFEGDIRKEAFRRKIREEIRNDLSPETDFGSLNQALMDLGSMICIPRTPRCGACPVSAYCRAHAEGSAGRLPAGMEKKERKVEERTVLIITDGERAAIRKRPEGGLLSGLYEFPNLEGKCTQKRIRAYLEEVGLDPVRIRALPPAKHVFSHIEWHMKGAEVLVAGTLPDASTTAVSSEKASSEAEKKRNGLLFVRPADILEYYSIPSAFSAYTGFLTGISRRSRAASRE